MTYFMMMRVALIGMFLTLAACTTATPPEPTTVAGVLGSRPPQPPSAVIHCDTDFTVQERSELQAAAEIWKLQTSGLASITLVWDVDFTSTSDISGHVKAQHNIMLRLEAWMSTVVEEDKASGNELLGVVSPGGGIHNPWHKPLTVGFVADRMGALYPDRAGLTQVALHEFGHVLGVPHQGAINAIMFHSAIKSATVCLKKPDLAAFCNVNECASYVMHPCE